MAKGWSSCAIRAGCAYNGEQITSSHAGTCCSALLVNAWNVELVDGVKA